MEEQKSSSEIGSSTITGSRMIYCSNSGCKPIQSDQIQELGSSPRENENIGYDEKRFLGSTVPLLHKPGTVTPKHLNIKGYTSGNQFTRQNKKYGAHRKTGTLLYCYKIPR